jgi:Concanavalin A-like lectin/glucanases superfamily
MSLDYRADGSWNSPWAVWQLGMESNGCQVDFSVTTSGSNNHVFGPALSLNNWHYLAGTYNGSQATVYLEGVPSAPVSVSGNIDYGTSADLSLGGTRSPYSLGEPWVGSFDEVRISTVARSAGWIHSTYLTDSGSFNNYASEESMLANTTPAAWSYYDNSAVANGATISSLLLSTSDVQETYEESNPTIMNPTRVSVGQKGEWNFSLLPNLAVADTTYYFRMIYNSGSPLEGYGNYPSISFLPDSPPATPNLLGPPAVVLGTAITTGTPSFNFNLSDPDSGNTVKYEIQISTSSSFSTLAVDYTSALATPGQASFTVGQSAGGGQYTVGHTE